MAIKRPPRRWTGTREVADLPLRIRRLFEHDCERRVRVNAVVDEHLRDLDAQIGFAPDRPQPRKSP